MNSCFKNRKSIAWLALGELEKGRAAALREHLSRCEGCRRYWEDLSNVADRLATTVNPDSKIEPSEFFHRRVAEGVRAAGPRSFWDDLAGNVCGTMLNWRVALPVAAMVMISLVALVASRQRPVFVPATSTRETSTFSPDLAPTIANYRRVASESPEKLDELLTVQGNMPLPPIPKDTASIFQFANASF